MRVEDGWGRWRTYINRQVLPQAPSPTMTSLRRISAMAARRAIRTSGQRQSLSRWSGSGSRGKVRGKESGGGGCSEEVGENGMQDVEKMRLDGG